MHKSPLHPPQRRYKGLCVLPSQFQNDLADAIHIFQCEVRIQRQGQHPLCHMQSHRRLVHVILVVEAFKGVRQRVEILPCADAVFASASSTSLRLAPNSFSSNTTGKYA